VDKKCHCKYFYKGEFCEVKKKDCELGDSSICLSLKKMEGFEETSILFSISFVLMILI